MISKSTIHHPVRLYSVCKQVSTAEEKSVLRNLLELYNYDFSEFDHADLDAHGFYGYGRLDHYWTEPGRYRFLVRVDGKLAGLVLLRTLGIPLLRALCPPSSPSVFPSLPSPPPPICRRPPNRI